MAEIAGVLLAAGAASRYGSDKLLRALVDGVPAGIAAARVLHEILPASVAVVRPGDHELRAALRDVGLRIVENPRAGEGMGGSLAAGVTATAAAAGWLVALADMPWLRPGTISRLAASLQSGASIVAPRYRGRRGHPVGFARHWRPQLLALSGEHGARQLLARYPEQLLLLDSDDPGTLADIDRPGDEQGI